MPNVITLDSPNRLDYLSRFVDQYTASRRADEERKLREQQMASQQAMAARQGEHWTALEGFERDRLANDTTRVGNETTAAATEDRIKRGVSVVTEVQRLQGAGDIEGAKRVLTSALQQDPELGKLNLNFMLAGGETSADRANANTSLFTEGQTGLAASGSPDVQARAFTQEKALGRPVSEHQFADQAQRQPEAADTKTPYGKTLNIQGGRMPSAANRLAAQTQKDVATIHESGDDRRQREAITNQRPDVTRGTNKLSASDVYEREAIKLEAAAARNKDATIQSALRAQASKFRQQAAELKRGDTSATSSASGPQIGDVKQFPNGKKGRFDGKGWVPIQ